MLVTHLETPFGVSSFTHGYKSGFYVLWLLIYHHLDIHHYVYQQSSDKGPWNEWHLLLIITLGKGALGGQTTPGLAELLLSEISPIPFLFCLYYLIHHELQ